MTRPERTAWSVVWLVIVVLAIGIWAHLDRDCSQKGGVLVRTAFSMKCLTYSTWNPKP